MASVSSESGHSPPAPRAQPPSPGQPPQKGVTIFDEPEHIEPTNFGDYDGGNSPTLVGSQSPKRHRATISGKKMTGRPAVMPSTSSTSVTRTMSNLNLDSSTADPAGTPSESKTPDPRALISQVVDWLEEEKSKRSRRKQHRHHHHHHHQHHEPPHVHLHGGQAAAADPEGPDDAGVAARHESQDGAEIDMSLEKLENILSGFIASLPPAVHRSASGLLRKGSIARKFKRNSIAAPSSDTDFFGDEPMVPNVEAYLDNSKTLAFTCDTADASVSDSARRQAYECWSTFTTDIVRLTHTLGLKGWRRVPIDRAADIDVVRLSGALTNAVYVVRPPKNMSEYDVALTSGTDSAAPAAMPTARVSRKAPSLLLLRIYGPQVEHLIDRDAELAILRRLARKRIGPRMLGTFENGRFEEFLHAKTLTAEDLRVPETSKQIAKRMRELHEGMDLLEEERDAGPNVFVNWDKWVDRCEKVITWLDRQVHLAEEARKSGAAGRGQSAVRSRYVRRGLICGVEWQVFRKTYDAYRKRLMQEYGGAKQVRKALVFAHNDTQYGNLMRLQPSGTSPLLQPSNQHKQLVVIDFEYASQNTVGLEFANHFTEWCYNYHHPELSHACDTRRYPDEKEQYRFVRSYVMHRPQFNPSASATPKLEAREKTNISDFMLDARAPPGSSGSATGFDVPDYDKEEREREKAQELEIQRLLRETRLWRLANSAQWVAWGIVQAQVPELDALEEQEKRTSVAGKVVEKVKELAGVDKKAPPGLPPSGAAPEADPGLPRDTPQDRPEGKRHDDGRRVDDEQAVTTDPAGAAPPRDGQHAVGENDAAAKDVDEPEEEFDYLAYAHDRALFFWGDCLQMGLVKEEELPEALRASVKRVPY